MAIYLNSKKTSMRYNNLGASGLQVSELSFGCMTFAVEEETGMAGRGVPVEEAYQMMETAYAHGINFFDNAEAYGGGGVSERVMGDAIQLGLERGTWERDDLVISTKIFFGGRGRKDTVNSKGLSRKHLFEGLKNSLARMRLDYVDLVFCHRPDPKTPIIETVKGMNHLINQGMAFYWGTSEWSAQQLQEAIAVADRLGLDPPLFDQCEYSMVQRERLEQEYLPLYPALGTTIWSPLAGGVLTGKYLEADAATGDSRYAKMVNAAKGEGRARDLNRLEMAAAIVPRLVPIAEGLGCTVAQLAVAWCATNPNVSTVILGATRLSQLEETLVAVELIPKLTPAVLEEIEAALGTKPEMSEGMQQVVAIRGPPARL